MESITGGPAEDKSNNTQSANVTANTTEPTVAPSETQHEDNTTVKTAENETLHNDTAAASATQEAVVTPDAMEVSTVAIPSVANDQMVE